MTVIEAPRASLPLTLLRLAFPVALARLGIMGMGVADTIMVGQLASEELPYQALGWAPTGVFLVAGIGLLTGVQVLGARSIGEGRPEGAGAVWRLGLLLGVAAGFASMLAIWLGAEAMLVAFGVKPELAGPAADVAVVLALSIPLHLAFVATSLFLEAVRRPTPATIVMWVANGLNIALNAWLIPFWGAEGSAWATFGARLFLAASLIAFVLLTPELRAYLKRAKSSPGLKAMLAVGVAAAVSQAVEAGAFSAMTVIAGRIGAEAVAGYQILLQVLALVFMIALGLSTATAVLAAEATGRGAAAEADRAAWTGLLINTGFMLVAALLASAFAWPIARAFTPDPAIGAVVVGAMLAAALALPPDGGQVVAAQALRAKGDNWFPTASHILAYAVVMPALAFWLAEIQGGGVGGLIWAIFWASVLSVGVLMGRLWFLRGRALG